MKPDLVITAVKNYTWEQLRPYAISLGRTGFKGDKVVLANNITPFTRDCFEGHEFSVVPFSIPLNNTASFVIKNRFPPFLEFLEAHGDKYRYIVWADSSDLIFQRNPSDWFDEHGAPYVVIAANECWRIKDEQRWNAPWVRDTTPEDYDWLCEYDILCGGTIAGTPDVMYQVISQIQGILDANPKANDQAALNYLLRKPFGLPYFIPSMKDGWTATCSSIITEDFTSCCGAIPGTLTDDVPVFDVENALVLTPDGKTPFVVVHQYNRDGRWTQIMHEKYRF